MIYLLAMNSSLSSPLGTMTYLQCKHNMPRLLREINEDEQWKQRSGRASLYVFKLWVKGW